MSIRKQTALWKTSYGQSIRICDMTDSHLSNAIRMFRRAAPRLLSNALFI
jgi:hypothetical protein